MNHILPKIKDQSHTDPLTGRIVRELIEQLEQEQSLPKDAYLYLLDHITEDDTVDLFCAAKRTTERQYGDKVYLRALIELSNICIKGCRYCGIRRDNRHLKRYRMKPDEVLAVCDDAVQAGYHTVVLQGGEDPYWTDDRLVELISTIRHRHPDLRITLSLGERSAASYQALFDAGANRYLLRHEAASKRLYEHLHPSDSSYEERFRALDDLKRIGYQVGAGLMVGAPTQTNEDLVEDLMFLQAFQPDMIGIGPYLCAPDTPFFQCVSGTALETKIVLALVRLTVPGALMPATTALRTLDGDVTVFDAGANVVMPNLTPAVYRAMYQIYPNKDRAKDAAPQDWTSTIDALKAHGRTIDYGVGDAAGWKGVRP